MKAILEVLDSLGITSQTGRWYAFWSGFGADLPIVAGLLLFMHHHNCHTQRCWRLGHPNPDGAVLCRHHRMR